MNVIWTTGLIPVDLGFLEVRSPGWKAESAERRAQALSPQRSALGLRDLQVGQVSPLRDLPGNLPK